MSGASGYIGRMLSSKLAEKHTILKISRKAKNPDIYSWDKLPDKHIDIVIHLAGKAHDSENGNYTDYYSANVSTTESLIEICNVKNIEQFIYLSTSKVYRDSSFPIDENSPRKGTNPYQITKILAEDLIMSSLLNTKYYILQPPLVIGKYEKGNLNLLKKLFSVLPVWPLGSFKNEKSVLSYKNLEFFIEELILKKPKSDTFIVCDDQQISTLGLIKVKFPKVLVLNTGKKFWIAMAKLMTLFKFKFFNSEVLNKLVLTETYSNAKIKKGLKIKETIYDVAKNQ
jgi:nucleoside-diphosphate-sugar epimerase